MKVYYYFLFRLYRLHKDKMKENDSLALFSALAVSTTIVSINLITLYVVANYFGLMPIVTNKLHMVLSMLAVGFINYHFLIKRRRFMNYRFLKDRKGGILIIVYILFTFLINFYTGQYNREKIFKEKSNIAPKEAQKESLEGKIRKWLE